MKVGIYPPNENYLKSKCGSGIRLLCKISTYATAGPRCFIVTSTKWYYPQLAKGGLCNATQIQNFIILKLIGNPASKPGSGEGKREENASRKSDFSVSNLKLQT